MPQFKGPCVLKERKKRQWHSPGEWARPQEVRRSKLKLGCTKMARVKDFVICTVAYTLKHHIWSYFLGDLSLWRFLGNVPWLGNWTEHLAGWKHTPESCVSDCCFQRTLSSWNLNYYWTVVANKISGGTAVQTCKGPSCPNAVIFLFVLLIKILFEFYQIICILDVNPDL